MLTWPSEGFSASSANRFHQSRRASPSRRVWPPFFWPCWRPTPTTFKTVSTSTTITASPITRSSPNCAMCRSSSPAWKCRVPGRIPPPTAPSPPHPWPSITGWATANRSGSTSPPSCGSYAEAYNNIAAACLALHRWDEAIQAATQALRLKPDFDVAQKVLQQAQARKQAER